MLDIFVSRPSWIDAEFEDGLKSFYNFLNNLDLNPRSLGTKDYSAKAPLDAVIQIMKECQGAIILGYPQIEIRAGKIKADEIKLPVLLPTEWNHIEAGLAYASGLPILVIHHKGVTRGIFDHGATSRFIHASDFSDAAWVLGDSISGAIKSWTKEVHTFRDSQPRAASPNMPYCPNCSTPGKTVYLTRLSSANQELFGSTHKCPRCQFMEKFK